jgi:hypothetical protein
MQIYTPNKVDYGVKWVPKFHFKVASTVRRYVDSKLFAANFIAAPAIFYWATAEST